MLTHVFGRPRRRNCMHCGRRRWVRMCRFHRKSTTKFQTVYFGCTVICADGFQWGNGVPVAVCRRCRDRFRPADIVKCEDCGRSKRCVLAMFRPADGTRRFVRLCRPCVRWHSDNGGRVQVVG